MTHTMNRRIAATLICLALAACKDSPPSGAGAAAKPDAAQQPVSVAAIAAEAKGFTVGSEMTVRRVFVFFDPQCPHCAALWNAAKPLKSQTRFVWIPVGLLNPTSLVQGAALLASADPVAAMDQHEQSMAAKQGGIVAQGDVEAQKALVTANTKLMNRYGFGSVPVVVANHAVSGELVVKEGSMPTAALAAALGLQAPATN
ncbi:MAG TPA: thioredoxin fold domain-containing protein [Ramlibacter sp.]|nr:thioredoxin fold domain-containing protein [Ramlibacter sp.]